MRMSFAVIGLGRFGSCVAKELSKNCDDVLAIDVIPENVSRISEYVNNCVVCDSTKKAQLEELGVKSIDHVIVAIGNNLQASILTTINLKALGVKQITVRVDDAEHVEVFKTLGATHVIIPEEASAISLANRIVSNNILDYYNIRGDYSIVQILVPTHFESSENLIELGLPKRFGISIVGIIRDDAFVMPQGTDHIHPKDILLVIGQTKLIRKFESFLGE